MAEHHTQGRQGQGSRHRRNNNNYRRRHRMPRPQAAPPEKPSLIKRILRFFGIGKKDNAPARDSKDNKKKQNRQSPPQKVRVAKTNNAGGNPAAKGRRRATSVAPTRNARLYVGNLSYETTESELEDLFKGFGAVSSVEIIYNPRTYKSKGYAFVEMRQIDDARRAAEVLHGQPFMGRELMVSAASDRPERPERAERAERQPAPEKSEPVAESPAPESAPEPAAAPADSPENPQ